MTVAGLPFKHNPASFLEPDLAVIFHKFEQLIALFLFLTEVNVLVVESTCINISACIDANNRDTLVPNKSMRLQESVIAPHRDYKVYIVGRFAPCFLIPAIELVFRDNDNFFTHSAG